MDGRVWREKGEGQIMRLYYNLKNKIHIFKKQNKKLSAFLNERAGTKDIGFFTSGKVQEDRKQVL